MEEDERREYEEDARKHGIPYMLDCMGLDGLGNDVNDLHKRILKLDAELAALKAAAKVARLWERWANEDDATSLALYHLGNLLRSEEEAQP